jgi:hypothetical protein
VFIKDKGETESAGGWKVEFSSKQSAEEVDPKQKIFTHFTLQVFSIQLSGTSRCTRHDPRTITGCTCAWLLRA